MPRLFNYSLVEVLLNVVLFAPIGFALALLLPRRFWLLAPTFGALLSMTVEVVQHYYLAGRKGTVTDIIANSIGALLGAILAIVAKRAHARRARRLIHERDRAVLGTTPPSSGVPPQGR
jgi:glycopeptide antibiotics resistance protein